ncbi:DUF892 family protein [Bradyrhizobium sp. USDA 4506]
MRITSFKDMYVAELQELASVEDQLAVALARMAEIASHPSLKDAFSPPSPRDHRAGRAVEVAAADARGRSA